jgi:hypothetical protein
MDQKKAAYAANKVGLACPELFDFYHPDSPKGVLRMDAVYRQLGLDAHYNDLAAAKADLDSLNADWSVTKAPVVSRAPTCHRVGGTKTIAMDIDESLTMAGPALMAGDAKTVENNSDGALQVDVLELLFDCPPDTMTTRTSGVGSPCSTDGKCTGDLVCDTAWNKCGPSPMANKIGTPCTSTVDCGSDSRSACQNEAGDGYPGGYCGMEPCNDLDVCPAGATCVAIGGETPACFKSCTTDDDCRKAEGYVCQLFSTTPPVGYGPSNKACAFACKRSEDCQMPLKCDVAAGKCTP